MTNKKIGKSYLSRVRRLDEVPSFMKKAVAIVKYQERVNSLKAKGAIPFTETGFEKISWDMFQKTEEPDFGSIWVVTTIKNANDEDEKWLVVNVDDNDKIIRSVKASITKKAQDLMLEEEFQNGWAIAVDSEFRRRPDYDALGFVGVYTIFAIAPDGDMNPLWSSNEVDFGNVSAVKAIEVQVREKFEELKEEVRNRPSVKASITKKAIIPGDSAMYEYEPGKFQQVFVAGIEERDPETGENTFKVRPMWGGGEEHFVVEEKKLKSASVEKKADRDQDYFVNNFPADVSEGDVVAVNVPGSIYHGEEGKVIWVDSEEGGRRVRVEFPDGSSEVYDTYFLEKLSSKKTSHTPGAIVQVVIPQGGINEKYNGKVGEVVAAVPDRSKISFKDMPSLWFEDNIIRVVASCNVCGSDISLQSLKKIGKVECRCGAFYSWRQLERIAKTAAVNERAFKKAIGKPAAGTNPIFIEWFVDKVEKLVDEEGYAPDEAYQIMIKESSDPNEMLTDPDDKWFRDILVKKLKERDIRISLKEEEEEEGREQLDLALFSLGADLDKLKAIKRRTGEGYEEIIRNWLKGYGDEITLNEEEVAQVVNAFRDEYEGDEETPEEKESSIKKAKIVPKGDEFCVEAESGRNMGCYSTKSKAEKRLKQVEMFKHMKGSKKAQKIMDFLSHENMVDAAELLRQKGIGFKISGERELIILKEEEYDKAYWILRDSGFGVEASKKTAQNVIFWFDDPKALKNLRYLQGPPTSPAGEEELLEKPGLEEEKIEGEEVGKEASKKTAQGLTLQNIIDELNEDFDIFEDNRLSVFNGDYEKALNDWLNVKGYLITDYDQDHILKVIKRWPSSVVASRVKKGVRNFEVGDSVQIMDKEGNTNVVPEATIAKVDEYLGTDGQMHETVEVTGSANEDEQMWYGEEDYQVVLLDPIEASKKKKTKVSTEIKTEAREKIGGIVKEALEKKAQIYSPGWYYWYQLGPNSEVFRIPEDHDPNFVDPDNEAIGPFDSEEEARAEADSLGEVSSKKKEGLKKTAQGGGQFEMLRGGGQGGSADQLEPMKWQISESKTPQLPESVEETEEVEEEIVIRVNPDDRSISVDFEGEKEEEVEKPVGAQVPPEKSIEKPKEELEEGEEGLEEIPVNF